jgi:hypothetical protein
MGNFRKNVKRAAKATKSVDKAQNALMKQMKQALDELESTVETKYSITTGSYEVNSYDGSTSASRELNINEVRMGEAQGLGDQNQRVGDQITLKHVDFDYRLELTRPTASEAQPDQTTTRVVLFWDNQPSAVSTGGGTVQNPVEYPQIFQSAVSGATSDAVKYDMILSQKDWDNRKRFSIIYDKTHTLCPNTNSTASAGLSGLLGPRSCTGKNKHRVNYKKQKIRFVNGGDIVVNRKLYFAAFSDVSNDVGGDAYSVPKLFYNIRTLYEDA